MVYDRFSGIDERIRGEGTHIIMPWVQRPIIFDVRSRPRKIGSLTGSRGGAGVAVCGGSRAVADLQMVNISLRVIFKPDDLKLASIYRTLGPDYDERVLPSIVNEVLKSVVVRLWPGGEGGAHVGRRSTTRRSSSRSASRCRR